VLWATGPAAWSQSAPLEVDLFFDIHDYTAYGITTDDQAGAAVLLADVNGDGFDDVVISARGSDGVDDLGPADSGEIYIRFGTPSFPQTEDFSIDVPDVIIYGVDPGGSGRALASGDLNGDGIDDLIIGAPAADGPDNIRANTGEVYIFYGRATWAAVIELVNPDPSATNADVTMFGQRVGDRFGFSLATGDVNGDLIDDLVVGALAYDRFTAGAWRRSTISTWVGRLPPPTSSFWARRPTIFTVRQSRWATSTVTCSTTSRWGPPVATATRTLGSRPARLRWCSGTCRCRRASTSAVPAVPTW
jgi:hypothetical protein